jgi:hypothetical protein
MYPVAMKGVIERMFWSEEGEARRNARRTRVQVWLHPGVWWGVQLASFAGAGCGLVAAALPHGRPVALAGAGLLIMSLLVLCVNDQVVRGRRRDGWEPISGIHTRPPLSDGDAPFAAAWRWTFHPQATATPIEAPGNRWRG